ARSAAARPTDPGATTVALIDESPFLTRWPDDHARREARRAAWRELVEAHGGTALFVDLADPDPERAAAQLAEAASVDAPRPDGRSRR
ncbi:hypothetical protein, partial [Agromyces sp. NDB4Y10]